MGSAAHRTTTAAEQHEHGADDQNDDAGGPKDPYPENETEQEEYESENNHASEVPRRVVRQTTPAELSLKEASASFSNIST